MVYRYLIYGEVQGVGFRKYVASIAKQHSLNGWVRNLSDGSVEALIDMNKHMLDEISNAIKQGPSKSFVDKMFIEECNLQISKNSFEILQTV